MNKIYKVLGTIFLKIGRKKETLGLSTLSLVFLQAFKHSSVFFFNFKWVQSLKGPGKVCIAILIKSTQSTSAEFYVTTHQNNNNNNNKKIASISNFQHTLIGWYLSEEMAEALLPQWLDFASLKWCYTHNSPAFNSCQ